MSVHNETQKREKNAKQQSPLALAMWTALFTSLRQQEAGDRGLRGTGSRENHEIIITPSPELVSGEVTET